MRLRKKSGSAMIIAIIIISFVGVVAISASQLVLAEASQSLRYQDSLVALYSAEAGIEWGLAATRENDELGEANDESSSPIKEGRFEIDSEKSADIYKYSNFATYIWRSGGEDADLAILSNSSQNISASTSGTMSFNLTNIEKVSGDDTCPATDDLFVYLGIEDADGNGKILNTLNNVQGVWNNEHSDQSIYLGDIATEFTVKPYVLTNILPSTASINFENADYVPSDCVYKTNWNVSLPGGELRISNRTIKSIGAYGDTQKEIEINAD